MKKTLIALSLAASLFLGNAMATSEPDAAAVVARAATSPIAGAAGLGAFMSATRILAGYGVNVVSFGSYKAAEKFAALSSVDARTIAYSNRTYFLPLSVDSASVKGKKRSVSLASAVQLYGELGVLYVGFSDRSKAEEFCTAAGVSTSFVAKTADGFWTVRLSQALAR